MPNYRYINKGNEKVILDNDMAGVSIAKNYNSFVVQSGGHQNLSFTERDLQNLISKNMRLCLSDGDFVAMRRYFQSTPMKMGH